MKSRLQPIVLLVCAALMVAAAQATTLARMTLEELASAADAVARVRCLGNESRREAGEIWTFTRFEVLETMKGVVPRVVTARLPGGRVGHIVAMVDAVPRFQPGEEAILFFERTAAGEFSITSWVQGTFRIQRPTRTGEPSVTQDSSAYAVFDPATRRFRAEGIRKIPLEVFRAQLGAAIQRQQSPRRR